MEYIRVGTDRIDGLWELQRAYKAAIGEEAPTDADFDSLRAAVRDQAILFYGCLLEGRLVACCSVSLTYSTFVYAKAGVLEDFYIVPECRHQGVARGLIAFCAEASGVSSLTVGCADCDLKLYQALGFRIPLGNLLAYDFDGR